ncbi:hypothetical protein F5B22DRAFT_648720 [Xylaria bambusicola]|uniref:uncharacterized protein n=1 Tax=Xylaria bambusicola TaxID=326684 RepID=UPI002008846E|nr:uncharacterized protein F5B22DRAFT_648720 [Xylaria bambusicola]KAI0509699.1 hypothetical protein F5B22DRAFT_648720 [Xylaria bambusicola]
MSRLPASHTNLYRSQSPVSVAKSDTTYHSFYDIELFEPGSPVATTRKVSKQDDASSPKSITRHDSGYESMYSGSSHGLSSNVLHRNTSQSRHQKRPSLQRAAKSTPVSYPRRLSEHSVCMTTAQQQQQHQSNSYYYFPSPEDITSQDETAEEIHPPPPQTTHYWMSDHTRRLEYAAIDAASRGIKGWVMKHVVPDCFVPKENRRLTFDDDTGSVRRYRLELELDDDDDDSIKKGKRGKKLGWLFGR